MATMPTPTVLMTADDVSTIATTGVHVIDVPAACAFAKGAARVTVPGVGAARRDRAAGSPATPSGSRVTETTTAVSSVAPEPMVKLSPAVILATSGSAKDVAPASYLDRRRKVAYVRVYTSPFII